MMQVPEVVNERCSLLISHFLVFVNSSSGGNLGRFFWSTYVLFERGFEFPKSLKNQRRTQVEELNLNELRFGTCPVSDLRSDPLMIVFEQVARFAFCLWW